MPAYRLEDMASISNHLVLCQMFVTEKPAYRRALRYAAQTLEAIKIVSVSVVLTMYLWRYHVCMYSVFQLAQVLDLHSFTLREMKKLKLDVD